MLVHGVMDTGNRESVYADSEGFDALAIGCFYDTALHEAAVSATGGVGPRTAVLTT